MEKFERSIYDYYVPEYYDSKIGYSPLYYNEVNELYDKNKEEIINYYTPFALVDKLAEVDNPLVDICNISRYNWSIKISNSHISILFNSTNRPDKFQMIFSNEVNIPDIRQPTFGSLAYNRENSFSAIKPIFENSIIAIIKDFPVDITLDKINGGIYHTDFNSKLKIKLEPCFYLKEIITLQKIKFLEYNIPKVVNNSIEAFVYN